MIMTVAIGADVTIEIVGELRHMCPFIDEVDVGTVTIRYDTGARVAFELYALREYLASFVEVKASHETVTAKIAEHLADVVGAVEVTTCWQTAGFQCTVTAIHG